MGKTDIHNFKLPNSQGKKGNMVGLELQYLFLVFLIPCIFSSVVCLIFTSETLFIKEYFAYIEMGRC